MLIFFYSTVVFDKFKILVLKRTYDLVGAIRKRRYRWLGHILRMRVHRLVKEAVRRQFEMGLPGNMFMDVNKDLPFDEITQLAQDRDKW